MNAQIVRLGELTTGKLATVLFDLYFPHSYKMGPLNHTAIGNVTVSVLGSYIRIRENCIPQVYPCQFTSKCSRILKAHTRRLLVLAKHHPTARIDSVIFIALDTLGFELTVFVDFIFALNVFPRYTSVMPPTICELNISFALKGRFKMAIRK